MAKQNKNKRRSLWTLLLVLVLPFLVWATYTQVYPRIKAATTQTPKYVRIHPGSIRIPLSSKPVYMSALAYDTNNQPIYTDVVYSWGMSSTTSVGTIDAHNDLATFYPKNVGNGNLFVQAINGNGQAMGSVSVTICSGTVCPTITPTPTPTPAPSPTPTNTPSPSPTPTPSSYSLTITSPNGGETLATGQLNAITWDATNDFTGMDIWYVSKNNYVSKIVTNAPNTGSFTWYVSTIYPTETEYKIKITGYKGTFAQRSDESDGYFSMLIGPTPTPTVTCNTADINKDGMVDDADRSILVNNFYPKPLTVTRADINENGFVDVLDYALYVKQYSLMTGPCL